jgi:hypothetical protein
MRPESDRMARLFDSSSRVHTSPQESTFREDLFGALTSPRESPSFRAKFLTRTRRVLAQVHDGQASCFSGRVQCRSREPSRSVEGTSEH